MTAVKVIDEIKATLLSEGMANQLKATAPTTLDIKRFQRVAIASVLQNPKLLECDHKSLYFACAQAAQAGLYTDGFLGEAYLVPYKGAVQFQPGYRGLMKLIRQSSDIASIHSDVVYEKDEFKVLGGYAPSIHHEYHLSSNRGKLKAAYAIVKFKDGTVVHKVIFQDDIDRAKGSSQSAASEFSPWKKHEPEMWIKTAIKKLAKMLPLSPEIQRVVEVDNNIEAGKDLTEIEGEIIASEPAASVEIDAADLPSEVPNKTKAAMKKQQPVTIDQEEI